MLWLWQTRWPKASFGKSDLFGLQSPDTAHHWEKSEQESEWKPWRNAAHSLAHSLASSLDHAHLTFTPHINEQSINKSKWLKTKEHVKGKWRYVPNIKGSSLEKWIITNIRTIWTSQKLLQVLVKPPNKIK